MIRAYTAAEVDQHQARLARTLGEAGPARQTVAVLNGDAVRALTGPGRLHFGDVVFDVPPVPYLAGIRLVELRQQLSSADTPAAERRTCGEIVRVMKRLVRPRGRLRRLCWALLPNPFRNASEQEIGELLGFFSAHRTLSRVRFPSAAPRTFGRST